MSMGHAEPTVKRRGYDASARRARAQRQHEATLDVAQALFVARGYRATTVASIADAAGVSPATIYKTYGGKAGLARDLCQRALEGTGDVAAQVRSDSLRDHEDPRSIVAGWGALVGEVSPLVSPLLLLLRAAAQDDPEAAALYADLETARLERMAGNARALAQSGHLRPDVTETAARDVLWLCSSPELFELLVQQRGWSGEALGRFAADAMAGTLLAVGPGSQGPPSRPTGRRQG
jgi:AcrR family transcriptional regulator